MALDDTGRAVSLPIGGRTVSFRPIGVLTVFSVVETWLQERRISMIHGVAAGIADPKERRQYYAEETDRIPWGPELEKKAIELMRSGDMPDQVVYPLLATGAVPPIPLEDMAELCHKATAEELALAVKIVLGVSGKKNYRTLTTFGRWFARMAGRRLSPRT